MRIVLIAAMAHERVIGREGDMPWHLPADLKHFKRTTLGHPLVMGRRTWESLGGRPLPGRPHILVSRDPTLRPDGAEVAASLDAAVTRAEALAIEVGKDALFIAGGGQIYAQAIDRADEMILTHIDLSVEGDTHFPVFDRSAWRSDVLSSAAADEGRPAFTIRHYVRPAD